MTQKPIPPPSQTIKEETVIPLKAIVPIVRWIVYSFCFFLLLLPFFAPNGARCVCGGAILGWFAGMLNAIINKK